MLYYILPKINNSIYLNITIKNDSCSIYNTISLYSHYIELNNCLNSLLIYNTSDSEKELLSNINYNQNILLIDNDIYTNNYEEIIYDFIEFIHLFKNNIDMKYDFNNILLITKNNFIFKKYFDYLKIKLNSTISVIHTDINEVITYKKLKYNFIFYEIPFFDKNNYNAYHMHLIYILDMIHCKQSIKGNCLIKISHMFYKPVLDFIYYLSSVFEKVYIIKPTIINTHDYKYIYCYKFSGNEKRNYIEIVNFVKNYKNNSYIHSLVDYDIPCFFYNKFNEINLIIGQQQLEMLKRINTIIKGYNKNTNIEEFCIKHLNKYKEWINKLDVPEDLFN